MIKRLSDSSAPHYLRAFLSYLFLTLLLYAPVLPHISSALPGGPVAHNDAWQNVWNLWWVHYALAQQHDIFTTHLLYYPFGVDLHLQTLNASNGVPFAPITALFGPIASYNLAAILAFALSGLGGYAFALRVSQQRLPAFIGGLIFTFSPFHLTKLWDGQLELIALQWLPFYALFLLRAVEERHWRDWLLAGFFLALIGYTSWYYFLFFAFYSVIFAVLWLAFPPANQPRLRILGMLAAVSVVGIVLLLPAVFPAFRSAGAQVPPVAFDPTNPLDLRTIHSADLVDFWLPSELHPLWGSAVLRVTTNIHPYIGARNVALGYLALSLALVAALCVWRAAWRWWVITLASLLMALGPLLSIAGTTTGIILPYTLLLTIPEVDRANRPSHFVVIATLMLAPLAALGIRELLTRLVAPRTKYLVFSIILILLAFEYWPPILPVLRPNVHPYYATLANEPGPLLIIPPQLESSDPLQAQMLHGRPILGGFVSRTPPYAFAGQINGIRQFWLMQPDTEPAFGQPYGNYLAGLNAYKIHRLVIEWDRLTSEQRAQVQAALAQVVPGVAPEYEDSHLSSYRIPAAPTMPLIYLDTGWYPEERNTRERWRWMSEQGDIRLFNPLDHPVSVQLRITAKLFREDQAVTLRINGQPATQWLVNRAGSTLNLYLIAPPGETTLRLRAPAIQEPGPAKRMLSIMLTAIEHR